MKSFPAFPVVVAALALFLAPPVLASGPLYTYIQLVPSGTDNTYVSAISGAISAGDYQSNADNQEHGYVYNFDTHAYTILDPTGSQSTYLTGISGNNVVGNYSVGANNPGFLYNISTQVYTPLNEPNADSGSSTNVTGVSANDVVGTYFGGGSVLGFVYDITARTYTTINPSGSSATNVTCASSTFAGGNYFNGNNNAGFVYNFSTKAYTTFDLSPGFDTHVTCISGNFVAGYYYTGSFDTGFIYNFSTHTTTLVDPSNGRATHINGISGNNVVGYYFDGSQNVNFIYNFSTLARTTILPDSNGSDLSTLGVSGTNVVGSYYISPGYRGFLGFPTTATITLSGNLNPTYDGTAHAVTATTSPAGLTVATTYQPVDSTGASLGVPTTTVPINAGRYAVVATVDDGTHMAMQTATLVIAGKPVTITVQNLIGANGPVYDGTAKSLTATASPTGVAFTLNYTNTGNPVTGLPINVGDYIATAVVTDSNYVLANPTTASGELDINFAQQPIDLSFLGSVTVNDVLTLPERTAAGNIITYSFADNTQATVFTTAYAKLTNGTDGVTDNILTILKKGPLALYATAPNDANHNAADPPGESIDVGLATAIMIVNNQGVNFDGQAHAASVTTTPSGLSTAVAFTYTNSQGQASSSAPSALGKYAVSAVINDPNDMYQGSATGTMVIGQNYASWKTQHITSTDPSVNGPAATPDHDTIPNLMKYITGIDPSHSLTSADRAALPVTGMDATSKPGTAYLTLTYRQSPLMIGTTVNVQTSTDLITWTTLTTADAPADMLSRQAGTDSVTGDPMMEVGVKITGARAQYIRLNVTQP